MEVHGEPCARDGNRLDCGVKPGSPGCPGALAMVVKGPMAPAGSASPVLPRVIGLIERGVREKAAREMLQRQPVAHA